MKIPAKLPQFLIQKSLIIVTSKQNAVLYEVYAGEIEEIGSVSVPKRDFFQVFKENLLPLIKRFGAIGVYIFSPSHMITDMKRLLSSFCRGKIVMSFKGSYIALHPLVLIKKIDQRLGEKLNKIRRKPVTEEEKRILERSEQACASYRCQRTGWL